MIFIVSGTPGTGKSVFAKKLAKKNKLLYVDVTRIIKQDKIYEYYDRKQKAYVVDIKKLNKKLILLISSFENSPGKNFGQPDKKSKYNGLVIDSHLSHFLPQKYVDVCYITRCSLKTLEKRLKKRNYSKKKIRDNLEAEIFESCLQEAIENKHDVKVINTG